MLVVRVEEWPLGDASSARLVGEVRIGSSEEVPREVSDFDYVLRDHRGERGGAILGVERGLGPWTILSAVLRDAVVLTVPTTTPISSPTS